jgi:acetoin utilization deacetylase AcuC-like enzyme
VLSAADAVMKGEVTNAFCAVRPPGHHAEKDRAMGFCLFNNVAVAAEYLIKTHGLERVAIVDFDVHHCNGTQHSFDSREDVLVVSLHEHPAFLYPGTGFEHEEGSRAGNGFTLNVPMLPHSDDDTYAKAFDEKVLPKLDAFKPQIILVSAGFDPVREDPLAHIDLTVDYVGTMTTMLADAASRLCGGKLVSVLEGGYHLESVVGCTISHVSALTEAK